MQADLEHLRQHYVSLSNEALLAIERAELVEAAQTLYDQELRQRKLSPKRVPPTAAARSGGKREVKHDPLPPGVEPPDWIEDAAEVFGRQSHPGDSFAPEVDNARAALEDAGIPCFIEYTETPPAPEDFAPPQPIREWKLLVPGPYNIEAASIIERDLLNEQFEADWKIHLEMLSDEELRHVTPEKAYCGLFDKVARVTRTYDEELKRRGLGTH